MKWLFIGLIAFDFACVWSITHSISLLVALYLFIGLHYAMTLTTSNKARLIFIFTWIYTITIILDKHHAIKKKIKQLKK